MSDMNFSFFVLKSEIGLKHLSDGSIDKLNLTPYFPHLTGGNYFAYTRHEPVGVCGQIIPVSVCISGYVENLII